MGYDYDDIVLGAGASERRPSSPADLKLEVIVIPVSDVDRAKAFYERLGWRVDADFPGEDRFRIVQFTPPGSPCSIQFGAQVASAAPGSAESLYLVVSDIQAAHEELVARGAEVSEVVHERSLGGRFNSGDRVAGPAPEHNGH